jgi:murein DD-endopeptidase MepM/ murein hydrolase activator NlpD
MTTLEDLAKQNANNTQREFNASFGQNGQNELVADTTVRTGLFIYFLPLTDGTFGAVASNMIGLTNSAFAKGIPIAFKATSVVIATGSGYLYTGGNI